MFADAPDVGDDALGVVVDGQPVDVVAFGRAWPGAVIAPAASVYGRGLQAAGEKDRVDNATVRTVFLIGPNKKVKLITPSMLRPTI